MATSATSATRSGIVSKTECPFCGSKDLVPATKNAEDEIIGIYCLSCDQMQIDLEELIRTYEPLATDAAWRFYKRNTSIVAQKGNTIDDVLAEANAAILKAADVWDPRKGVYFSHYVKQYVRWMLLHYHALREQEKISWQISLKDLSTPFDDSNGSADDYEVPDDDDHFAEIENIETVRKLFRKLSHIERQVMYLYYYQDKTYAEIGREFGHSDNWAGIHLRSARNKLRTFFG